MIGNLEMRLIVRELDILQLLPLLGRLGLCLILETNMGSVLRMACFKAQFYWENYWAVWQLCKSM